MQKSPIFAKKIMRVFFSVTLYIFTALSAVAQTADTPLLYPLPVILIDNGHGEQTAGKRSPDGILREYAYTRQVAAEVVAELRQQGYNAQLLTPEKSDISLGERCRRVNRVCNRVGKKNALLVSVHLNAAGMGDKWASATGWAAFTSRGRTQADILADSLYAAARRAFPDKRLIADRRDGDSDLEAGFYILRHTLCAAVLTENFFQDSRFDCDFLMSGEGFAAVVRAHVEGIIAYVNRHD